MWSRCHLNPASITHGWEHSLWSHPICLKNWASPRAEKGYPPRGHTGSPVAIGMASHTWNQRWLPFIIAKHYYLSLKCVTRNVNHSLLYHLYNSVKRRWNGRTKKNRSQCFCPWMGGRLCLWSPYFMPFHYLFGPCKAFALTTLVQWPAMVENPNTPRIFSHACYAAWNVETHSC